jgi:hypothetical protein
MRRADSVVCTDRWYIDYFRQNEALFICASSYVRRIANILTSFAIYLHCTMFNSKLEQESFEASPALPEQPPERLRKASTTVQSRESARLQKSPLSTDVFTMCSLTERCNLVRLHVLRRVCATRMAQSAGGVVLGFPVLCWSVKRKMLVKVPIL